VGEALSAVTVRIVTIHGGEQERDYGPHVYEAVITVSIPKTAPVWDHHYLQQGYAERVCKALFKGWCEEEVHEGPDDYFSAHLKEFKLTHFIRGCRSIWHVRIETPFTD